MKISKLIEILAQYLQMYGDIEVMYSDSDKSLLEDIGEMDLNIEKGVKEKRLVLNTILEEKLNDSSFSNCGSDYYMGSTSL